MPNVYHEGDHYGLLVVKGTNDPQGHPNIIYDQAGAGVRKTFVNLDYANHWGYTSLCHLDGCVPGIAPDGDCAFGEQRQKKAAAAYLAALLTFHGYANGTVKPYLDATRLIELDGASATMMCATSSGY